MFLIKKVSFFNKQLLEQFGSIISAVSVILSLIIIFADIPDKEKPVLGCIFIALLVLGYIALWIWANKILCRKIRVNNSVVEIKTGDIFAEPGLKAIAFNEYFDTLVDEDVIASATLNGKFINQKIDDVVALDALIKDDIYLQDKILDKNVSRKKGKSVQYQLGSILVYEQEYLLTAFSRFDEKNNAYLSMSDYLKFLVNFWSEVDRVYAGRSITIPLFGSGMTRFRGYDMINDQELLEMLIWSFKISRIKFTYPAQVTILINPDKKDRINFYDLKGGDCSVL